MDGSAPNYLKKELQDLIQKDPTIFEFIENGSLDGVWFSDIENPENEWVDDRFWENLGYSARDKKHLASERQDLINKDDLPNLLDNFRKHSIDPSYPYDQIVRYRKSDGTEAWVRCRGIAIRDKGGKPIRFLGVHNDITREKRASNYETELRRELEESNKILNEAKAKDEAMLAGIGDAVVVTGKDGNIIYINHVFTELIGIKEDEAVLKLISKVLPIFDENQIPLDESKRPVNLILKGQLTNPIQSSVLWYKKQKGTLFPVANTASPVVMNGKVFGVIEIFRDITKEKEIDKAKTEFVSLASHQLKTPIGAINWNMEMMLSGDYGIISDKQREVIEETYVMSKRMNELVNDLLNISRIELGVFIIEPEPTNYVKLCEEVLLEMEPRRVKKNLEIIKSFEVNLPNIPTDPKLLRIIFQNLLSNSMKYTGNHGKIWITLKSDDKDLTFSVSNNGEPIPESDQGKIFTKMFRARNAEKQDPDGTGLGLYILKQIMDNVSGKVWFTSKQGENTTFFCSIPLSGMAKREGTKRLT